MVKENVLHHSDGPGSAAWIGRAGPIDVNVESDTCGNTIQIKQFIRHSKLFMCLLWLLYLYMKVLTHQLLGFSYLHH